MLSLRIVNRFVSSFMVLISGIFWHIASLCCVLLSSNMFDSTQHSLAQHNPIMLIGTVSYVKTVKLLCCACNLLMFAYPNTFIWCVWGAICSAPSPARLISGCAVLMQSHVSINVRGKLSEGCARLKGHIQ